MASALREALRLLMGRRFGKLAAKAVRFHQAVEAGKIAPRVANDTMRDLSRALVRLNYA